MISPIHIIEIGNRPPTGVSSCPFWCLGENRLGYYVKLKNGLVDERIAEWMFGFLATELGLPTPEGRLVIVDEKLSRSSALDTSEFGFGIGYGSQDVQNGEELSFPETEKIPRKIRAETLLFDWWIRNEDRKLGELGGNPNLLITTEGTLSLIDHGNAIDPNFDEVAFFDGHAFSGDLDFFKREDQRNDWLKRAEAASLNLEARWRELPEEWFQENPQITLKQVERTLEAPWANQDNFWAPFAS